MFEIEKYFLKTYGKNWNEIVLNEKRCVQLQLNRF